MVVFLLEKYLNPKQQVIVDTETVSTSEQKQTNENKKV